MKSAHRHELQTNALAQRLDVALHQVRPYISTIVGVIIAILAVMVIWSYVSSSSVSHQGEAWNAYNQALGTLPPNLDKIRQSAQEYPGTKMQELADITWADGQVFNASQSFINNRRATTDALNRATTAYQSVLQTSNDERLQNRAHLGMARVYEMRNELDKARDEYLKVKGGYADFAKEQAKRLEQPDAKETYAWLEKAQPPVAQVPMGPGVPGQRPAFSAGDISLPAGAPEEGATEATTEPGADFDEVLKGLREFPAGTPTTGGAAPAPGATPSLSNPPTGESTPPATEGATPAATEGASPEGSATPPADTNAAPSGTEPSAPEAKTEEKAAE